MISLEIGLGVLSGLMFLAIAYVDNLKFRQHTSNKMVRKQVVINETTQQEQVIKFRKVI